MTTTILETQRITLSLKTMWTIVVSGYFIASQRIADKISETNERINNWTRVLESQQALIISNRYKDSVEKALIELQIEYIRQEIKQHSK